MPRPLIHGGLQKTDSRLTVTNAEPIIALSPLELERRLRQKRSSKYVENMTKLDAGGHVCNHQFIQSLLDVLREELPEISIEQLPLGIVAKCYLQPPYEVHCLDRDGSIIQHFRTFEPLPPLLEKARELAIHGGYAFIEVYYDCLRAVKDDGNVSVVKEG